MFSSQEVDGFFLRELAHEKEAEQKRSGHMS